MKGISLTTQIAAPVERVFALFTDFRHAADHLSAVTRMELLTAAEAGYAASA